MQRELPATRFRLMTAQEIEAEALARARETMARNGWEPRGKTALRGAALFAAGFAVGFLGSAGPYLGGLISLYGLAVLVKSVLGTAPSEGMLQRGIADRLQGHLIGECSACRATLNLAPPTGPIEFHCSVCGRLLHYQSGIVRPI